jgi:putative ATP-binding cassette transporter
VPQGKRLIVTGPNGAGKSALLLATAGLWPAGRGRVVCPDPGRTMLLPQQPYTPAGRLRDVLCYGLCPRTFTDDQLLAVLREVGLESVVRRSGGLDAEEDWAHALSAGERWALAFARLLLAGPRWAFLDCPGGALDPGRVEQLYAALSRTPTTYVSVGDHPALRGYHDLRLELDGNGGWLLQPVEDGSHNGSVPPPDGASRRETSRPEEVPP